MSVQRRKGFDLQDFAAVILTGGSSGIGASFIKAVYNIEHPPALFNLSRRKPDTKYMLEGFQHLETDLIDPEQRAKAATEVITQVEKLPEGPILLINNSGFGAYGTFPEPEWERNRDMITLNVLAAVELTARFEPVLARRGGAVMNISSIACFQPTPYLAAYGASKSFLTNWSLAVGVEWKEKGIHVLTVCPGPTSTGFFKAAGFDEPPASGFPGLSADEVAEASIKALRKGKRLVVTGWINKLITFFGRLATPCVSSWFAGVILKRIR